MREFVRRLAVASSFGVGILAAGVAGAAPRLLPPGPPEPGVPHSGPLFVQSTAAIDAAAAGRVAMNKGDCLHAVEAFDNALRTGTDPTVQRDRGICH